jgi:tRNA 2-thiouridine synthesizing protein A
MAQDDELDLRGLKCPLPALFARRALEKAAAGATLVILTDDPMAPIDVPHMCRQEGYEVLSNERDGEAARMILGKPIAAAADEPSDPDSR